MDDNEKIEWAIVAKDGRIIYDGKLSVIEVNGINHISTIDGYNIKNY